MRGGGNEEGEACETARPRAGEDADHAAARPRRPFASPRRTSARNSTTPSASRLPRGLQSCPRAMPRFRSLVPNFRTNPSGSRHADSDEVALMIGAAVIVLSIAGACIMAPASLGFYSRRCPSSDRGARSARNRGRPVASRRAAEALNGPCKCTLVVDIAIGVGRTDDACLPLLPALRQDLPRGHPVSSCSLMRVETIRLEPKPRLKTQRVVD
jgi:hypothetical protein